MSAFSLRSPSFISSFGITQEYFGITNPRLNMETIRCITGIGIHVHIQKFTQIVTGTRGSTVKLIHGIIVISINCSSDDTV